VIHSPHLLSQKNSVPPKKKLKVNKVSLFHAQLKFSNTIIPCDENSSEQNLRSDSLTTAATTLVASEK
jgi:hypothetical protein